MNAVFLYYQDVRMFHYVTTYIIFCINKFQLQMCKMGNYQYKIFILWLLNKYACVDEMALF